MFFFFFSKYSGELQEHKYVSKTVCLGRAVLQELVSQEKCMEVHTIFVCNHFNILILQNICHKSCRSIHKCWCMLAYACAHEYVNSIYDNLCNIHL